MKLTISTKLFLVVIPILISTGFLLSFFSIRSFEKDYRVALENRSITLAQNVRVTIKKNLEFFPLDSFSGMDDSLISSRDENRGISYIHVSNLDGLMLYSTEMEVKDQTLTEQLPTLKKFTKPSDSDTFERRLNGKEYYETLIPLYQEADLIGAIHVGIEADVIDAKIVSIITQSLLILGILLVIGILSVYVLLTHVITKPLRVLTSGVHEIKENNDLSHRIQVRTSDEIGQLADSFNSMTASLQKSYTALKDLNASLEDQVKDRTKELNEQMRNISALLDNMKQAVFSVNAEGRVISPVSKYSEQVFRDGIEGKRVSDSLYMDLDRHSEVFAGIVSVLSTVFGEGELQWEVMAGLPPKQIEFKIGDITRILKISYNPLFDESVTLQKLMFVVEDVTDVLALEQEVQKAKESSNRINQLLQEMAALETEDLRNLFSDSYQLFAEAQELAADSSKISGGFPLIMRALHTIKGNARGFGLNLISSVTHHVEHQIEEIKKESTKGQLTAEQTSFRTLDALGSLQNQFLEYGRLARRIFKIDSPFEGALIKEMHQTMQEIDIATTSRDNHVPALLEKMLRTLRALGEDTAAQIAAIAPHSPSSLVKLRSEARKIYSRSSFYTVYPTQAEHWISIFLAIFDVETHLTKGSNKTADGTIAKSVAHLLAQVTAGNRLYLAAMAKRLESLTAVNKADSTDIRDVMLKIRRYAQLVSILFSKQCMKDDLRKQHSRVLQELPKDTKAINAAIDSLGQSDSILAAVARQLNDRGVHPNRFISPIEDWYDESPGGCDLAEILQTVCESGVGAPLADVLEKRKNEKLYASLLHLLDADLKTPGPLAYLLSVDLAQLLAGFSLNLSTAISDKSRTIEILETSFKKLQSMLNELNEGKGHYEPGELVYQCSTLLHVEVKPNFYRFSSMIREISGRLGKMVDFVVAGDEVTLDKERLHLINDAFVHLIRNSLDHGIETTEERGSNGKRPAGTLRIECRSVPGGIEIRMHDDGRGIDADRIAQKAVAKGLVDISSLAGMTEEDKVNLIFIPGFSTVEVVSELSGRGVGMDIVKANIIKAGGNLQIRTKVGFGTEFLISIARH